MKGLNVTNIPLLKSLVHSMVMDMVTTRTYVCVRRLTRCFYSTNLTVLVDPGKLTLNFGPFSSPDDMSEEVSCAVGVATITVTATPIKSRENSSKGGVSHARCLTLRLGMKKYEQQLSIQGGVCRGTYSYLVSNLQHDMVHMLV